MADFLQTDPKALKLEMSTLPLVIQMETCHWERLQGLKILVYVNDMRTHFPLYKYVDDGILFEICTSNSTLDFIQDSVNVISKWPRANRKKINTTKTKEMVICFCKNPEHTDSIPRILIDGVGIERINQAKVLRATMTSKLRWNGRMVTWITLLQK